MSHNVTLKYKLTIFLNVYIKIGVTSMESLIVLEHLRDLHALAMRTKYERLICLADLLKIIVFYPETIIITS